jgi:DNA-binding NarL/FixJ family response regulator
MLHDQVKGIRLLLVDDHQVVRLGLREVFSTSRRITVIGEAGTAVQALTEAIRLKPDVVLMDLRLPDGSGVEACREIRVACPNTRVLFLTSFEEEDAVLATALAGANGYLLKSIECHSLIKAIEDVASGQSILNPGVTGSVMTWMGSLSTSNEDGVNQPLSPQERRLLPLVAEGKTNKEVATALGLTEATVKSYLHNIFQKLQISRRSQVAALLSKRHRP